MPLPAESEGRGTKGRGSGEVSVEQGVRPVASSPLARIAAATQRARGGEVGQRREIARSR